MDYTVHGILQARIQEWVAFPFSRGSSRPGIEPGSPALLADSLPTELSELWLFQWSYMDMRVGPQGRLNAEEFMLLRCGAGEDS